MARKTALQQMVAESDEDWDAPAVKTPSVRENVEALIQERGDVTVASKLAGVERGSFKRSVLGKSGREYLRWRVDQEALLFVPEALSKLKGLVRNSRSDKVKLEAIQEVMRLARVGSPEVVVGSASGFQVRIDLGISGDSNERAVVGETVGG